MRFRRRIYPVTGPLLIALLVAGLAVAILWPMPSEAEQEAAKLEVGTMLKEMEWFHPPCTNYAVMAGGVRFEFADGSTLTLGLGAEGLGVERPRCVVFVRSIRVTPPAPVDPLTRLRRTLARVFPFLAE
jgi:hypothetical protein